MVAHAGREYHDSMRVPFAVQQISAAVGCGVVATAPITKGCVIFHEADMVEEHYSSRCTAVAMLRQLPVAERRRMLHHWRAGAQPRLR